MPLAPYWRVVIDATNGGRWAVFAEVAFMDANGNDLSIGGQAIASSFYGAGFEPQKAFDKNISESSRWSNSDRQFPAWIGYIHPQPVEVAYVRMVCDTSVSQAEAQLPRGNADVHIQWSLDGQSWSSMGRYLLVHDGAWKNSTVIWLSEVPNDGLVCLSIPARIAYSSLVNASIELLITRAQTARDVEFGGSGRIWGINEVETSPGVRIPSGGRVFLMRQRDKVLVRETWAESVTGAWEFNGIDQSVQYLVLAEDMDGNYRPVAANRLVPEVSL